MRYIPNILSVIRIAMVGVFVHLFMAGRHFAALLVYVLAFLTDVLDGYLARRTIGSPILGNFSILWRINFSCSQH